MKCNLLGQVLSLGLLSVSLSMFGQQKAQVETFSVPINSSEEIYVRNQKADIPFDLSNPKTANNERMELVNGNSNNVYQLIYSMIKFPMNRKPGCNVSKATLRLVTNIVQGNRNALVYGYNSEGITSKTTWNTAKKANDTDEDKDIDVALSNGKIASFTTTGGNLGQTMVTTTNETFKKYEKWVNSIDVTKYVQEVKEDNVGFMLTMNGQKDGGFIRLWSSEATDQTVSWQTDPIKKEDLIPLLTIEYESVYTLKVTDAKAATLVLPYDAKIPEGVKAYTLTYTSGDKATAKEVKETIPANTPVLINAEAGNYDFVSVGTYNKAEAPSKDALTGVYAETTVPQNAYVLQNQDGKVAFYKVSDNTNIKLKACQAYLVASQIADAKSISIDFSGTTGITDVQAQEKTQNEAIYTLGGVRVNKAQLQKNQVYISKGKAFVAK